VQDRSLGKLTKLYQRGSISGSVGSYDVKLGAKIILIQLFTARLWKADSQV